MKPAFLSKITTRPSFARSFAIAVSVLVAAAVPEPDGFRMGGYKSPVPDSVRGGSVVHVAALPDLLAALQPVLIDVLPAPTPPADQRPGLPRMPLSHSDIPGSLWLPDVGRGALSPQTDIWFRRELALATKGDLKKPVVFYCLSNCWMSWNATRRAISYGYSHAIWFPEGADGWSASGHKTEIAVPAQQ